MTKEPHTPAPDLDQLVADADRGGRNAGGVAGATLAAGALIWSAGAGGGDPERTWAVDRDAAIRTMDAAEKAGVGRYVMVSYLGAGPDHGVDESDDFFAYAEGKTQADEHLKKSSLRWTILGPGMLTLDDASGKITVLPEGQQPDNADTSRANVAAVAHAVLSDDTTIGRKINFVDGDTPIAEAISAS